MNVISEILRAIRLTATVYFQADFCEPWGIEIKGGQFANFHIVSSGHCWLVTDGHPEQQLIAGDLVMFPHGKRHTLSGSRDTPVRPAEDALTKARTGTEGRPMFGGVGKVSTTLICGHFEYDGVLHHPLIATLPDLLLLKKQQLEDSEWLGSICELAVKKSEQPSEGSTAVVDRLAETLLIEVMREYTQLHPENAGFWTAARDRQISVALSAIHETPQHPWSVAELAKRCWLSESAFAHRFSELLGTSPMRYVTLWRMQKARELLLSSDKTLADIALDVGYASEWAFSKAFKRECGESPGQARREGFS